MPLIDDAMAVQHLVLECLNDAFDERLKVRRFDRRFLDGAAVTGEHVVERLNVFGVLVRVTDTCHPTIGLLARVAGG